jgi:glycosyltransferase involved in cell wall biosynthesis
VDSPSISICLPVLNARKFLPARLDSIFGQSFKNWEIIVIDGYSEDGSWEYLKKRCEGDCRVHLQQAPRDGIYAAINLAIEKAGGDWIYIATADDTMEPRCLEVLLAVGSAAAKPCIAQCGLTLIDEGGSPLPEEKQWPRNTAWHPVFGEAFECTHERRAPFDGAAVMVFETLITSLTQALFPRSVFQSVGSMPIRFGSAGDMAWQGLAGFFHEVRYTPERLATWRMHGAQATASGSTGYYERNIAITDWILSRVEMMDPGLGKRIRRAGLTGYNHFAAIRHGTAGRKSWGMRLATMVRLIISVPRFYVSYLAALLQVRKGRIADPVTHCRTGLLEKFLGEGPLDILSRGMGHAPASAPYMELVANPVQHRAGAGVAAGEHG